MDYDCGLPAPHLTSHISSRFSLRDGFPAGPLGRRVALSGAGAAVAALLLCAQSYYWPQIGDDSFIFFRYAHNLACGAGLTWNSGEMPVEGFSSPLWVLLLAAAEGLGLNVVLAAKWLGAVCFWLVVAASGVLVRDATGRAWAGVVAGALVGFLRPLQYWAPSGMETALYAALVVWAVCLGGRRAWLSAAAVLGAVGISRPEGPLVVAVVLAAFWYVASASQRPALRRVSVLAVLPGVLYAAFRAVYYRDLFPNTYYAKTGEPFADRLFTGLTYVGPLLPLLFALAVVAALAAARRWREPEELKELTSLWTGSGALLFAVAWGGGDWMWEARLLVPAAVLLVCGGLAVVLSPTTGSSGRASEGALRAACLAAVVISLGSSVWRLGLIRPSEILAGAAGRQLPVAMIQEGSMTMVSREVGEFLRRHAPEGAAIAVNHAGAVPFYSELATIDMTGLNDRHIARRVEGGLHGKYDPDYVLGRRPFFIVLNSRERPRPYAWYSPGYWEGETALVRHPEFRSHYRFVDVYWEWRWFIPENFILVAQRVRE